MSDEQPSIDPAAGELRISGVGLHAIGQRLIDLGHLLVATGQHTENDTLRKHIRDAELVGEQEVYEAVDREAQAAIRQTLTGLNTFRREYADWERLTVEYALTRQGFTQRDVATLLGVGLSTVNRWAQHPLAYED
jgi:DNA-binding NtrC family response regulator